MNNFTRAGSKDPNRQRDARRSRRSEEKKRVEGRIARERTPPAKSKQDDYEARNSDLNRRKSLRKRDIIEPRSLLEELDEDSDDLLSMNDEMYFVLGEPEQSRIARAFEEEGIDPNNPQEGDLQPEEEEKYESEEYKNMIGSPVRKVPVRTPIYGPAPPTPPWKGNNQFTPVKNGVAGRSKARQKNMNRHRLQGSMIPEGIPQTVTTSSSSSTPLTHKDHITTESNISQEAHDTEEYKLPSKDVRGVGSDDFKHEQEVKVRDEIEEVEDLVDEAVVLNGGGKASLFNAQDLTADDDFGEMSQSGYSRGLRAKPVPEVDLAHLEGVYSEGASLGSV